jgi:hypothetical protein
MQTKKNMRILINIGKRLCLAYLRCVIDNVRRDLLRDFGVFREFFTVIKNNDTTT